MEIKIDKKELLTDLHRMSAHLGMKLGAPELVASTVDDEDKIELLLQASFAELLNILSPYATIEQIADEAVFTMDMPANWKKGQANALVLLSCDYLRHSLLARWLDSVKSDNAMLYRTLNRETADAIVHILSLREKPTP